MSVLSGEDHYVSSWHLDEIFIKKILGLLFFVSSIIVISHWFYSDYWYRQAIPENIGLGNRVSIVTNSAVFSGCGIAVYELNEQTFKSIHAEGVNFFSSSIKSRGHDDKYYAYSEWKETPRKDWRRFEDWSYQLLCGGEISNKLFNIILSGGQTAGSFYTSKAGANLMVLPDERLVVFTYYD